MQADYNTFRPEGFGSVNPYIFADKAERLVQFLKGAFSAEELNRSIIPVSGEIANCILKLGDSCVMVSQARGDFLGMRSSFYLYVENVDEVYQQALDNGADSVLKPMDMEYQDRQGGIKDPEGNYWWISKRLVAENYQD